MAVPARPAGLGGRELAVNLHRAAAFHDLELTASFHAFEPLPNSTRPRDEPEHVVGCEHGIEEAVPALSIEDLAHACVVGVVAIDERIQEARIEEDQVRGSP
jgi:hypothetical protein